jgi:sugar lactone lactonase YvrE
MKEPERNISSAWPGLAGVALLVVLAGCATGPSSKPAPNFSFYPPPPETPRLQFLTSYSGEKDLGGGASKFATFVTGAAPSQRAIVKPYGLAVDAGLIYVCDTGQGAIDILDLNKKSFAVFEPKSGGQIRMPINLAIDSDGTKYLADRAHDQVLIYAPDGTYQGAIGEKPAAAAATANAPAPPVASPGAGEKGLRPTDVVLTDKRLYVTDLNNNCVRVYEKATRQWLFNIPRDSRDEAGKLFAPTNLALDAQDRLYVSDFAAFCVKTYDADGKYLRTFGRAGDRPGEFSRPKGVAVDRQGRVFVVDAAAQVVQIFDAEGRLLLFFGEPKASAAPLDLPAKVVIDYKNVALFQRFAAPGFQIEYLVLVTNQLGDRKVSVYGFGGKK